MACCTFRLAAVEAGIPVQSPECGAETQQMNVIEERFGDRELRCGFSAPGWHHADA